MLSICNDLQGHPLPHFTPTPSPHSSGVDLFAQELSLTDPLLLKPYVFPPLRLVGPVFRFLKRRSISCTFVTLDVYPRKYWWPFLEHYTVRSVKLGVKGSQEVSFSSL